MGDVSMMKVVMGYGTITESVRYQYLVLEDVFLILLENNQYHYRDILTKYFGEIQMLLKFGKN